MNFPFTSTLYDAPGCLRYCFAQLAEGRARVALFSKKLCNIYQPEGVIHLLRIIAHFM